MNLTEAISQLQAENAVAFVTTQREVDEQIPVLLESPAKVRAVVVTPRESIDLECLTDPRVEDHGIGWDYKYWNALTGDNWCDCQDFIRPVGTLPINWLIIRGDTDPIHPDHVRSLVDQAKAAGVPVWLEWGEWRPRYIEERFDFSDPTTLIDIHGLQYHTYPSTKAADDFRPMRRVGSALSGSTLDGVEYRQVPEGFEVTA